MKQFPMIQERLQEEHDRKVTGAAFYVENGFFPSWAEEHRGNRDAGVKAYSTETRWNQYQRGEITREKAVELAIKRMHAAEDKRLFKKLAHLQAIAGAPDLDYFSISVEWVKSRTWGHNPHAEMRTENNVFSGAASGWGYDKASAAMATAFNQCNGLLKALCTVKELALQNGQSDRSKTACTGVDNREVCGYGAGYDVIPYFEGGVGVSSLLAILDRCGYSILWHTGKHSDFYTATRKNVAHSETA